MSQPLSPYTELLIRLQPPGLALPTDPDSNWVRLLSALGLELERLDSRLSLLQTELTVGANSQEMLDDWEAALGLPDPCAPAPKEASLRRARIRSKLSSSGGQNQAYFLEVLSQLGYVASITELTPFEMGQKGMGDPVGGGEWANTWEVAVPGRVLSDVQQLLMCVINQIKPAHTAVTYSFGGLPPKNGLYYYYSGQLTYNGDSYFGA